MNHYNYLLRNDDCPYQVVDDEAVIVRLLPGGDCRLLSLNPIGTFIWELADGHLTIEEIGKLVAGRYEAEVRQATDDVATFADNLVERGLAAVELERAKNV